LSVRIISKFLSKKLDFRFTIILSLYYTSCVILIEYIMGNKELLNELLIAWEETYKKGQLTFWIFLSLKEGKKYVDEIKTFVEEESNHSMTCESQSLYRNLRKFQHVGVVDFETGEGNKGPERKYYFLTELGNALLNAFIERNIKLFYNEKIKHLLNKED